MNTLLALVAAGVAAPPAVLACPTPVADRGAVKAGPPLAHTFDLTHRGPAGTLSIITVESGCGCLRRDLDNHLLQPGQSAKLTIEVNTLTQPDGPNRWQVVVGYRLDLPNQLPPQTGELVLTVAATLSREVTLGPPQVAFSCTGAASQVLTLTDRRAKPLTVLKAVGSSPHLTAEVALPAPQPDGGRVQTVTVKLAADAPPGHRDEMVFLQTDDPAYPEFRVPVRVLKRAAGGVAASPGELAVRFAPGQAEVSALVQLRAPDGKPVSVAAADSDHPGVTVKWSAAAGPVATVRVTVAAAAGAAGTCKVRVRLADPAGQEVVIPVGWGK